MKNSKHDKSYQLIVIGAGSGGLVAAEFGAKLGAKVALIEATPRLGGECLWNGCVPSKALIHSARAFWQSGHSQQIGVLTEPKLDFNAVMEHIQDSMHFIEHHHDNDEYFEKRGVDVFHGKAAFIDDSTVRVGEDIFHGRRIIIATGSSPAIPSIRGLETVSYLTNETIFSLKKLPKTLTVIGGGPIGCELGQAFAMLGSKVTILQSGSRLLPKDEPEVSEILLNQLKEMGIQIILNAEISAIKSTKQGVEISTKQRTIVSEELLIATGRRPNMPTGLREIGVTTNDQGIEVDKRMRTSLKTIYAVGDCNGGVQFTHAAGQAVVAVQNSLLGIPKTFDQSSIPWATFTTPEIAHFGATKGKLDSLKQNYQTARINFSDIDKAVTEKESGYIEILTNTRGSILSATVVGANASEVLAKLY